MHVRQVPTLMSPKAIRTREPLGIPTNGTLATSQKEKIDAMEMWDGNPFVHYNIKKINNHYRMQKKVAREQCPTCKSRYINARCTFKLCSKCCVERTTEGGPCRVKTHRIAKERRDKSIPHFHHQTFEKYHFYPQT